MLCMPRCVRTAGGPLPAHSAAQCSHHIRPNPSRSGQPPHPMRPRPLRPSRAHAKWLFCRVCLYTCIRPSAPTHAIWEGVPRGRTPAQRTPCEDGCGVSIKYPPPLFTSHTWPGLSRQRSPSSPLLGAGRDVPTTPAVSASDPWPLGAPCSGGRGEPVHWRRQHNRSSDGRLDGCFELSGTEDKATAPPPPCMH